ncbi:hypothetical protein KVT40_008503 [Elsinoe batatas]|uniref:Uncharacterized protein n=1 Tax=Elsinoe batatas TaxID=2601811 RepID=A0A8K0KUM6_9PEZI|nr:hypothetical protein KVT40_008503 [Elsinoe batatas]
MKYQRPKVEDSASRQTSPVKPSMPARPARSPSTPGSTRTQISPGWSMKVHRGSEDYEDWPIAGVKYPLYEGQLPVAVGPPIYEGSITSLRKPTIQTSSHSTRESGGHWGVSAPEIDPVAAMKAAITSNVLTADDLGLLYVFRKMERSKSAAVRFYKADKQFKAATLEHEKLNREVRTAFVKMQMSRQEVDASRIELIKLAHRFRETIGQNEAMKKTAASKGIILRHPSAPNTVGDTAGILGYGRDLLKAAAVSQKIDSDTNEGGGVAARPQQDIKKEEAAALPSPKVAPKPARSGKGAAARGGVQKRKSEKATSKKTASGVVKQTAPVRRSGRAKPASK